jgi:chemotaxis methyl-accepting protein methylase
VCIVTLVAFLFTIVPPDMAWALKADYAPKSVEFNPDKIIIPQSLALIKDSWQAPNPRSIVIHIQDAHCNYYAQTRIAAIIEYLNDNYGVNTVNLEGGTRDYDLSIFTGIKDKAAREKAAEHFVREGVLNGAEYFAANNPEKVSLWGIEDAKLYIDNLRVYRDSLGYKDDVSKSLKNLNYALSNLKTKIYSRQLLELDRKTNAYKEKSVELKDYIAYLINLSKYHNIDISDLQNIGILNKTISLEPGIDFKRANIERDELVDRLTKLLSRIEVKELVEKAVEFKLGRLTPMEFYYYLIAKSKELRINLDDYKNLVLYIGYTQLYSTIKNDQLFRELDGLEDKIKEKLYENPDQRELDKLSKNLGIIRNIFGITLTPDEYRYYKSHRDEFKMEHYMKFVNNQAQLHGFNFRLDNDILKLDDYLEKIEKFYTVSLKRDQAFLKNLRKPNDKRQAAILITGGFHSENLAEIFKKNNISYISIAPNFTNEDGYECPYFKLLSGQKKIILAQEMQKLTGETLAYCSPLSSLANAVNNELHDMSIGQTAADLQHVEDETNNAKLAAGRKLADNLKNILHEELAKNGLDKTALQGRSAAKYTIFGIAKWAVSIAIAVALDCGIIGGIFFRSSFVLETAIYLMATIEFIDIFVRTWESFIGLHFERNLSRTEIVVAAFRDIVRQAIESKDNKALRVIESTINHLESVTLGGKTSQVRLEKATRMNIAERVLISKNSIKPTLLHELKHIDQYLNGLWGACRDFDLIKGISAAQMLEIFTAPLAEIDANIFNVRLGIRGTKRFFFSKPIVFYAMIHTLPLMGLLAIALWVLSTLRFILPLSDEEEARDVSQLSENPKAPSVAGTAGAELKLPEDIEKIKNNISDALAGERFDEARQHLDAALDQFEALEATSRFGTYHWHLAQIIKILVDRIPASGDDELKFIETFFRDFAKRSDIERKTAFIEIANILIDRRRTGTRGGLADITHLWRLNTLVEGRLLTGSQRRFIASTSRMLRQGIASEIETRKIAEILDELKDTIFLEDYTRVVRTAPEGKFLNVSAGDAEKTSNSVRADMPGSELLRETADNVFLHRYSNAAGINVTQPLHGVIIHSTGIPFTVVIKDKSKKAKYDFTDNSTGNQLFISIQAPAAWVTEGKEHTYIREIRGQDILEFIASSSSYNEDLIRKFLYSLGIAVAEAWALATSDRTHNFVVSQRRLENASLDKISELLSLDNRAVINIDRENVLTPYYLAKDPLDDTSEAVDTFVKLANFVLPKEGKIFARNMDYYLDGISAGIKAQRGYCAAHPERVAEHLRHLAGVENAEKILQRLNVTDEETGTFIAKLRDQLKNRLRQSELQYDEEPDAAFVTAINGALDTYISRIRAASPDKPIVTGFELARDLEFDKELLDADYELMAVIHSELQRRDGRSGVYVYPLRGPDLVLHRLGKVLSIEKDEVDYAQARHKFITIYGPEIEGQIKSNDLNNSLTTYRDAWEADNYIVQGAEGAPRTLILKGFSSFLFSYSAEHIKDDFSKKQKELLQKVLANVDRVIILDKKDYALASQIRAAGFDIVGPQIDNIFKATPLAKEDQIAVECGHFKDVNAKSLTMPTAFMMLEKKVEKNKSVTLYVKVLPLIFVMLGMTAGSRLLIALGIILPAIPLRCKIIRDVYTQTIKRFARPIMMTGFAFLFYNLGASAISEVLNGEPTTLNLVNGLFSASMLMIVVTIAAKGFSDILIPTPARLDNGTDVENGAVSRSNRRSFLDALLQSAAVYGLAGGLIKWMNAADRSNRYTASIDERADEVARLTSLYSKIGFDKIRFVSPREMYKIAIKAQYDEEDSRYIAGLTIGGDKEIYVSVPGQREKSIDFSTFCGRILNDPGFDTDARRSALRSAYHEGFHAIIFKSRKRQNVSMPFIRTSDWVLTGKPFVMEVFGGKNLDKISSGGKIDGDNTPVEMLQKLYRTLRGEYNIYKGTPIPYEEVGAYVLGALSTGGGILDLSEAEQKQIESQVLNGYQVELYLDRLAMIFLQSLSKPQFEGLLDYYAKLGIKVKIPKFLWNKFYWQPEKSASQIGKRARGEITPDKKLKVTDSKNITRTLDLTDNGNVDMDLLLTDIGFSKEVKDEHKHIILDILKLHESSPPKLYLFTELVDDLFGVASDGAVAVLDYAVHNKIVLFHELAHLLIDSGRLKLKFIERSGEYYIEITGISDHPQKVNIAGAALAIAKKDPADSHYLLRALQREFFNESDLELTFSIKNAQFVEELLRDEKVSLSSDERMFMIANMEILSAYAAAFMLNHQKRGEVPFSIEEFIKSESEKFGVGINRVMEIVDFINYKTLRSPDNFSAYLAQSAAQYYYRYYYCNIRDGRQPIFELDMYPKFNFIKTDSVKRALLGSGIDQGIDWITEAPGNSEILIVDKNSLVVDILTEFRKMVGKDNISIIRADISDEKFVDDNCLSGKYDVIVLARVVHELGRTGEGINERLNNMEGMIHPLSKQAVSARIRLWKNVDRMLVRPGLAYVAEAFNGGELTAEIIGEEIKTAINISAIQEVQPGDNGDFYIAIRKTKALADGQNAFNEEQVDRIIKTACERNWYYKGKKSDMVRAMLTEKLNGLSPSFLSEIKKRIVEAVNNDPAVSEKLKASGQTFTVDAIVTVAGFGSYWYSEEGSSDLDMCVIVKTPGLQYVVGNVDIDPDKFFKKDARSKVHKMDISIMSQQYYDRDYINSGAVSQTEMKEQMANEVIFWRDGYVLDGKDFWTEDPPVKSIILTIRHAISSCMKFNNMHINRAEMNRSDVLNKIKKRWGIAKSLFLVLFSDKYLGLNDPALQRLSTINKRLRVVLEENEYTLQSSVVDLLLKQALTELDRLPADMPEMPRLGAKVRTGEVNPEEIKWKAVGTGDGYENLDEARRALLSSKEPYCFTAIKEPTVTSLETLVKSGNLELGIIRLNISQSPGKMQFVWYMIKGEPERFVHPIDAPMDFRLHIHSKRRTQEINKYRETYMYPGQTDQRLAFQAGRIEYVLSNKGICAYGKFIDKPMLIPWKELRGMDRRLSRLNQYVLTRQRRAILSAQNISPAISNTPEFPRIDEPVRPAEAPLESDVIKTVDYAYGNDTYILELRRVATTPKASYSINAFRKVNMEPVGYMVVSIDDKGIFINNVNISNTKRGRGISSQMMKMAAGHFTAQETARCEIGNLETLAAFYSALPGISEKNKSIVKERMKIIENTTATKNNRKYLERLKGYILNTTRPAIIKTLSAGNNACEECNKAAPETLMGRILSAGGFTANMRLEIAALGNQYQIILTANRPVTSVPAPETGRPGEVSPKFPRLDESKDRLWVDGKLNRNGILLMHALGHFPENGMLYPNSYFGDECALLRNPRNIVEFSWNNIIHYWMDTPYAVIVPLSAMSDRSWVNFWFTATAHMGPVSLPKGTTIMVRRGQKVSQQQIAALKEKGIDIVYFDEKDWADNKVTSVVKGMGYEPVTMYGSPLGGTDTTWRSERTMTDYADERRLTQLRQASQQLANELNIASAKPTTSYDIGFLTCSMERLHKAFMGNDLNAPTVDWNKFNRCYQRISKDERFAGTESWKMFMAYAQFYVDIYRIYNIGKSDGMHALFWLYPDYLEINIKFRPAVIEEALVKRNKMVRAFNKVFGLDISESDLASEEDFKKVVVLAAKKRYQTAAVQKIFAGEKISVQAANPDQPAIVTPEFPRIDKPAQQGDAASPEASRPKASGELQLDFAKGESFSVKLSSGELKFVLTDIEPRQVRISIYRGLAMIGGMLVPRSSYGKSSRPYSLEGKDCIRIGASDVSRGSGRVDLHIRAPKRYKIIRDNLATAQKILALPPAFGRDIVGDNPIDLEMADARRAWSSNWEPFFGRGRHGRSSARLNQRKQRIVPPEGEVRPTKMGSATDEKPYHGKNYVDVNLTVPGGDRMVLEPLRNQSMFFRHRTIESDERAFIVFLDKLADETKMGKKIRILSAGCSTGEEVYTIIIALLERGVPSDRFEVIGVDKDLAVISKAKKGIYEPFSVSHLLYGPDKSLLEKYFSEEEPYEYRVKEKIRKLAKFKRCDLTDAAEMKKLGLFDGAVCITVSYQIPGTGGKRDFAYKNIAMVTKEDGLLFTDTDKKRRIFVRKKDSATGFKVSLLDPAAAPGTGHPAEAPQVKPELQQALKNVLRQYQPEDADRANRIFLYTVDVYTAIQGMLEGIRPVNEQQNIFIPVSGDESDMAGVSGIVKEMLRHGGINNLNVQFYDGTLTGLQTKLDAARKGGEVTSRNSLAYIDSKLVDDTNAAYNAVSGTVTVVRQKAPQNGPGYLSVGGHVALGIGVLDLVRNGRDTKDDTYWERVRNLVRKISGNEQKYEGITKEKFLETVKKGDLEIDLPPIEKERINENMRTLCVTEKAVGTAM